MTARQRWEVNHASHMLTLLIVLKDSWTKTAKIPPYHAELHNALVNLIAERLRKHYIQKSTKARYRQGKITLIIIMTNNKNTKFSTTDTFEKIKENFNYTGEHHFC